MLVLKWVFSILFYSPTPEIYQFTNVRFDVFAFLRRVALILFTFLILKLSTGSTNKPNIPDVFLPTTPKITITTIKEEN